MCGLAGYYFWQAGTPPDLGVALRLLRHRGPDAAGSWEHPQRKAGLAHTRLSILDLSEAANQPFSLHSTHLVYNGELYNFRELAQEGGFVCRTSSDTEVLLHAWLRWGQAALPRLSGMFAFAVYDEAHHALLLARDPYGIKPLWVAVRPEGVFFASELKVLRAWGLADRVRPASVTQFLHLGFVPAPHSWYEGVYKVQPGEAWHLNEGRLERFFYYERPRLWAAPGLSQSPAELMEKLETTLAHAVRSHLVSDVPVGLFLSGGTDSSLVAALAAQQGVPLQAFTMGFTEGAYNELPYAKAVAAHLGLPLESALLSPDLALNLVPELPAWYDEPFGDYSALPTYLVSRLAASRVKVVLAGDGGDELFGGYGRYRWAERLHRYGRWFRIGAPLLSVWPASRTRRVARLLHQPPTATTEHLFSQEEYFFSWQEVRTLYPSAEAQPWQSPFPLPEHPLAAQAAWDFLHYLPDDLLTKVDRASMQHSLEVRVPLLDKVVVELAWQIPPSLKRPLPQRPPQYKPLLRTLLKKYLPATLVERKKWGFTVPMATWLRGPLYEWAREHAHPDRLARAYDLTPQPVERLWERFLRGDTYLAKRLWLLIQLGLHT